ncbi:hypothetical protein [Thermosyntropha sp.]|uniref:hypothetical protein n=1 Tax=Thermosyntropha sp. TaxID=2740820 RepID=UPI0025F8AF26|nr:hypothetical protein [Thermosyntropha sp.]MBO8158669.1 hypothetical protein [Thermosyntropha sp.]
MFRKTFYLLLIILGFYIYCLINYPYSFLQNSLYKEALSFYGSNISDFAEIKVVYNPGLRDLGIEKEEVRVKVFLPVDKGDFVVQINRALREGYNTLVECSAFDSFHTTSEGQILLKNMRDKAYRVVIFDGGHHLPTLGMNPDIIIMPEIKGYTAHSYMHDAIKIKAVLALAEKADLKTVIAVAPRWALVKDDANLRLMVERVLEQLEKRSSSASAFNFWADKRISKFNGLVFAYINYEYYENKDKLEGLIKRGGQNDITEIYLAFDYNKISQEDALVYANALETDLNIPVNIVNEPFTVFDVLWRKG